MHLARQLAPTFEMVSGVRRSPADSSAPAHQRPEAGRSKRSDNCVRTPGQLAEHAVEERVGLLHRAPPWGAPAAGAAGRPAEHDTAYCSAAQRGSAQRRRQLQQWPTMQGGEVCFLDVGLGSAGASGQVCRAKTQGGICRSGGAGGRAAGDWQAYKGGRSPAKALSCLPTEQRSCTCHHVIGGRCWAVFPCCRHGHSAAAAAARQPEQQCVEPGQRAKASKSERVPCLLPAGRRACSCEPALPG